jgi:hypothetical protein
VRIIPAQVLQAWFERNPDGVTFGLRVVFQGQPVEKASVDSFLASHPRPSYAPDLGVAATEEGLVVSSMSIRDSKDSEQFRTGKAPSYGLIPWKETQHIGELLESVRPRTVTFDDSLAPNLSDEKRLATRQTHRSLRRHCTGGAIAYRKTSSVGEENRVTRDSCKAFGLATGWQLRRLMTEPHLECPHCGAWTPLKADPTTGAPLGSLVRCTLCHRTLSTGQLLADRARTRGVHGWLEDISGPRVVVASPVLPQVAKHDRASASAADEGRKAITRGASAKEGAVRIRHKVEVPSTRPTGAQSVTQTTAEFGCPSHDYCASLTGHLSSIPVTHTTRGLVRRVSHKDRLHQRSASYRSNQIPMQHLAFVESLTEGLSFTNL